MALKLNTIVSSARSAALPIRQRKAVLPSRWQQQHHQQQQRLYSDAHDKLPKSTDSKGPNTDPELHVSEEAAAMSKTMGGSGPDLSQGTPVEEIVKDDPSAKKNLPKVMQHEMAQGKAPTKPNNTRSYSTTAIRRSPQGVSPSDISPENPGAAIIAHGVSPVSKTPIPNPLAENKSPPANNTLLSSTTAGPDVDSSSSAIATSNTPGHKFPLPELPLPPKTHLHHRYEPIVDQFVGLLTRHGKKAVAQRNVNYILSHLRSSPPPQINPSKPLLPGSPPPSHLPLNPLLYLQLAIDSIAPMLRIRNQKGAAGGGVALQIPVPLFVRQRRRTAMTWIIDAAEKKKSKGSGKNMFAQKLAEEIVAVVEGRSSIWEKRNAVHKMGVSARANLLWKPRKN